MPRGISLHSTVALCKKGIWMLTIDELESACDRSLPLDFSRHEIEAPKLSLQEIFYPLGFPTVVRTNSANILSQMRDLWSVYTKRFDTRPIRVDVHVVEGDLAECLPAPVVRILQPLMTCIADADNYSIANLEQGMTQIILSRGAEKYRSYLRYFFLESAPLCQIVSRFATPVHAGCVTRNGCGFLLCGDSGAGKSSISYACAQAGWTYVTDDASYLLNEGKERLVTGNCHQVRFRPSAAELFLEIKGLEITPRAAGKPSIELPTAKMPGMICSTTANVDYLVFLNRRTGGPPELRPYRKDVARQFLRQVVYGSAESLAVQYAALEQLLTAEVFELRYSALDWAVHRLEALALEGR
jgi:hypothetical protein